MDMTREAMEKIEQLTQPIIKEVSGHTYAITAGGITTVTARVVDGAGNASGQTATAKVYIDPAPPNVPGVTLSTEQWTNSMVTAAIKDNGDAHSGVARTEYSLDGGSWTAYSGVLSIAGHGKHTVSARAIDNVGRISGTASKTALVDKVAPAISKVEQQPDSGHTEMTLAVTATDADSGVKGYAVTTEEKRLRWTVLAPTLPRQTTTAFTTSGQRTRRGIFPPPQRWTSPRWISCRLL